MMALKSKCEGHPAGPNDPMGKTVFCDGSCIQMALVHPWQDRGDLGKAPYRCIGMFSYPAPPENGNVDAYNYALRIASETKRALKVEGGGICEVCGQSLMNNFVVQSADGKRFVVGCDCVTKTGDSMLITEVQAKERARKRELRREKARIEREAKQQAFNLEMQAQRERNNGLTDYEVAEKQRRDAMKAEQERHKQDNLWLIDAIYQAPGDFVQAMIAKLEKEPFNAGYFSVGQFRALVNVWCHGYKGKERIEREDQLAARFKYLDPQAMHPSWRH